MSEYVLRIIAQGEDRASGPLDRVGGALSNMGQIAGGILASQVIMRIGEGLLDLGRSAITSSMEAEDALARLGATIQATGREDALQTQAVATAGSLQEITRFSDEAILDVESLLLTFDHLGGDVLPRTTGSVLDIATAMRTDANTAARMLGRALQDPEHNLTALTRITGGFTEEQEAAIVAMAQGGDQAGAQAEVLEILEGRFGGMAEAMGETTSGQMERFRNQWDEILETLGSPVIGFMSDEMDRLMPLISGAGEALASFLQDDPGGQLMALIPPGIRDALGGFWESVQGLGQTFADLWPTVQGYLDDFAEWFGGMAGAEVPGVLGNLSGILDNLSQWWQDHGADVMAMETTIWRFASVTGMGAVDLLTGIVNALMELAGGDTQAAGEVMGSTLERFADAAAGIVGMDWDSVVSSWQANWDMLQTIVTVGVGNLLDPLAGQVAEWIVAGRELMDGLKQGVSDAAAGLAEAVLAPIRAALDGVRDLLGIDSPSTVFAGIGEHMMDGMALGIGRSADAPVLATARAGAGAAATAWDQSRNLTMGDVHIFGGMDDQAFDDRVRDWLRRG